MHRTVHSAGPCVARPPRLAAGELSSRTPAGRSSVSCPRHPPVQGPSAIAYLLSPALCPRPIRPTSCNRMATNHGDGTYTFRFHRRGEGGLRTRRRDDRPAPGSRSDPRRDAHLRSRRAAPGWPPRAVAAPGGESLRSLEGRLPRQRGGWAGRGDAPRSSPVSGPACSSSGVQPREAVDAPTARDPRGLATTVCTYGRNERPGIDELGFHPNHIVIFLGVHQWMGRRIVAGSAIP